jgi:hypothetical protein
LKVYINDKKLKYENYSSLTLPELLKKIKNDLDNEILREIYVNEVQVNEKYLRESLLDKEDIEKIKFVTQNTEELVKNSLNEADDYLPKLKKGILDTADYFRNGEDEKGNNTYQQIVEGLEWYTDIITKILSIINHEELYNESQEVIKDLNEPLTELMEAYNKNDIVLIADILEYEIVDYIERFIELNNKAKNNFEEMSDI